MNLAMRYDIILRGGRVVDPASGLDAVCDAAVKNGRLAALAPRIALPARSEIDCAGKVVTPGLIDPHVHCYPETHNAVLPDDAGVRSGAVTVADGGSAGYLTFPDFRDMHLRVRATDVYAFLHQNPVGEAVMPEIWDPGRINVHPERVLETMQTNREHIVGLKNRATGALIEHAGIAAIRMGRDICAACGLPFMIHIGLEPSDETPDEAVEAFTGELLDLLAPGDIIAHAFTAKRGRIFRPDGRFDERIRAATARGVLLDASIGRTNFSWDVLELARQRGFAPDLLSTDLTTFGMEEAGKNLGVAMSKLMAAGIPLEEVIRLTTLAPARALGMEDRKGGLVVGRMAEITVLEIREGDFLFKDRGGRDGTLKHGATLVAPWLALRGGDVYAVTLRGEPTY